MKKKLLLILTITIAFNAYSQISFEKGYYINNSNQKIDCFIKNIDWANNPTEFEYKLTTDSDKKKVTIKTVKEFSIYNISKYVRSIINIDKSSNSKDQLSTTKKAIFKKEELFLKVLIEGKASLYLFKYGSLRKYFYSKDGSKPEQLVFKKYLITDHTIGENNRYRQQLWTDLKCSTFRMNKIKHINYVKNDLIRLFVEYNECTNQKFINFEDKQKKDLFNLNFRLGFSRSSLSIRNAYSNNSNFDFNTEIGVRFGIEAEFIMPFNKNKWAILIEPTYQYFQSEEELSSKTANYNSFEVPIGIRHYFFLNENSKIFINASYIINFTDNSVTVWGPGADLAFGIGYKHIDKYSLELRYQTSTGDFKQLSWAYDYNTFSLAFGYSLF